MMPAATWPVALRSCVRLLVASVFLAALVFLAATGALSTGLTALALALAAGFAAGLLSDAAGVWDSTTAGASNIRAEAMKDFMGVLLGKIQ